MLLNVNLQLYLGHFSAHHRPQLVNASLPIQNRSRQHGPLLSLTRAFCMPPREKASLSTECGKRTQGNSERHRGKETDGYTPPGKLNMMDGFLKCARDQRRAILQIRKYKINGYTKESKLTGISTGFTPRRTSQF